MLSIGIFLLIAYVSITIPLFNMDRDLWFLFVIMIPIIFLAIVLIIAGIVSLVAYTQIKYRIKQKKYYCFFCGFDLTTTSKEGSLLCNSCGNKVLFCNLCSKIINPREEIVLVKPCNHVFHKVELLDFVEEENHCPKCKRSIEELSFDLKKETKEFWEKAK
jgi:DNA-directed RNA polymerase subunit RPC12/RpoP